MIHRDKKPIKSLLVAFTLTVLLTACGGGSETTPTNQDTGTANHNANNPNPAKPNPANNPNPANPVPVAAPIPAVGTGNAITTISFIELNDLHANLVPHWSQVRNANGNIVVSERGGLVRIAQKIEDIRASNPNTILMNIGDTYHGGAEAMFTIGNDIVAPVDALNVDIGVPGNWDFAFGSQVTNARFGSTQGTNAQIKAPNYPMLGANVTGSSGQEFLAPTFTKVINGVTVGFIGLTSDIIEKMHRLMALGLTFVYGEANYINLINQYSSQLLNDPNQPADIIVVMSELGIHKDIALADALTANNNGRRPVDIFFSAHTHELTASNQQIVSNSGALVVEAGDDGYLGRMDVGFDANKNPVSFNWTIYNIDNTIQPNMGNPVVKQVSDLVAIVRNKFNDPTISATNSIGIQNAAPLGNQNLIFPQKLKYPLNHIIKDANANGQDVDVAIPLDRKNSLENSFNNAYTDLLRRFTKTDIAMTPGFRFGSTIIPSNAAQYWQVEASASLAPLQGKITVEDVYRFINSPYFLVTSTITAQNLKTVLESILNEVYSPVAFEQAGGWMFGFSGLDISVNLKNTNGNRVLSISNSDTAESYYDGTNFATRTLSIAGCGRPLDTANTVCSYPGFGAVTKLQDPNGGNGGGPLAGGGNGGSPFGGRGNGGSPFGGGGLPGGGGGLGGGIGGGYPATDFLIDQLQQGHLVMFSNRKNITDVSNTPMWPTTEFVQPLRGVQ